MADREEQLGFELGGSDPAGPGSPNLDAIREDLGLILQEAADASAEGPWDHRTLRYKKIVFLQLAKLLPDDEGEQLRFDFAEQYERIEGLLAA